MNFFRQRLTNSPALARVFPFALFVVLTFFQGRFGEPARYWIYFLKTLTGVWSLWLVRPLVAEMKWNFSWEALLAGLAGFAIWVGIDPFYPHLPKSGLEWNPSSEFNSNPALGWFFVIVRIVGTTLVGPPLEEVFYRSFLYRWMVRAEFQTVRFAEFSPKAFIFCVLAFGFAHHEWLAGIACGTIFQWLVLKKNRLGDAITAHATSNLLLGLWVVWKNAWHFW